VMTSLPDTGYPPLSLIVPVMKQTVPGIINT
jgi:hypothetical protein